ncbi:MAG: 16S rRNA (cytidine(1402)-2'-O)-methyltransferase [Maricaulaceae bacterium]
MTSISDVELATGPDPSEPTFRSQPMGPGLYVVSTPVGNLGDITLRALDILRRCDRIYAEDTRITKRLLSAYSVTTPLSAYHDHNGAAVRPRILEHLRDGERVALVSDAGTPLVSDPGYKLVRSAIEAGYSVTPAPGASAVLAALVCSGLPSDRFAFLGFAPNRASARAKWIEPWRAAPATLVAFETPARAGETLLDLADQLGDRPAALCRELTKRFEEVRRGRLRTLAQAVSEGVSLRGELVIVVGPPGPDADRWSASDVDAALARALHAGDGVKNAAQSVAAQAGWSRRAVYDRAVALKEAQS